MTKLSLNLFYLKYFYDAVLHGSISASAKINHVSQSAVSQAIAKLEEGMGHLLISHQPNRFKVTEMGMRLFRNSTSIFHAIHTVEESISDEGYGKIDFACTHSFALALLPDYLKQAQKELPLLRLSFRIGHPTSIKEWLKKGMIDFGILLDCACSDLSSFEREEIYEGQHFLYVSKKCKDVHNLPFLLAEESREINLLKKAYLKCYGKEISTSLEIPSWEVIARLTEQGLGIGFFPDYVAYGRQKHLNLFSNEMDQLVYSIYAIFPKRISRNPLLAPFLELLRNHNSFK